MDVEMRASDEDRHRMVAALQRHTAAGRLTLDEFSDRVGEVYAARTLGELATVGRDLPPEPVTPVETSSRHLLIAFVVAVAALLVLGLALTLR